MRRNHIKLLISNSEDDSLRITFRNFDLVEGGLLYKEFLSVSKTLLGRGGKVTENTLDGRASLGHQAGGPTEMPFSVIFPSPWHTGW